jgi:hypothetical protein
METLRDIINSVNAKLGKNIYSSDMKGNDGVILASNGEGLRYLAMNGNERTLKVFMIGVRSGINSMIQKQMIEEEDGERNKV